MDGHSTAWMGTVQHFAARLHLRYHSTRLVLQSLCEDVIHGQQDSASMSATDLFPHHASLSIIYVVYFVKNHKLNVSDDVCSLVKHGPQDLCGHDQAGALRLQTHIPSQQACLQANNKHSLRRRPTTAMIWQKSTQRHAYE